LRISINKGKEREREPSVAYPSPTSLESGKDEPKPKKKAPVVQATPVNEKKVKEVLKTLTKVPEAAIFLRPVDPVLDGCPT
jgi:transcription initiation factor TFIID subunit 2